MSSPPTDDAGGETAVPRTPNGAADLLTSPDADEAAAAAEVLRDAATAAAHLQATPQSVATDFSIDEEDGAAFQDASDGLAAGADGEDVDENEPLEGNYSDSDDDEDEDGGDQVAALPEDSQSFQLAARTNQIMSSYRDYVLEIQSDPIQGEFLSTRIL